MNHIISQATIVVDARLNGGPLALSIEFPEWLGYEVLKIASPGAETVLRAHEVLGLINALKVFLGVLLQRENAGGDQS